MAEPDEVQNPNSQSESRQLEIPTRRVKNIMKLDEDIGRVNSEALFLIASSTELFLQFLAEQSARVAIEKKKKTVRTEHMRVAVKRHRPTADFLLDSLPVPEQPPEDALKDRSNSKPGKKKAVPFAMRSIDAFFNKCGTKSIYWKVSSRMVSSSAFAFGLLIFGEAYSHVDDHRRHNKVIVMVKDESTILFGKK